MTCPHCGMPMDFVRATTEQVGPCPWDIERTPPAWVCEDCCYSTTAERLDDPNPVELKGA